MKQSQNKGSKNVKNNSYKNKKFRRDGAKSSSWFGSENLDLMTIVDGEYIAKEIEEQGNLLLKEGYQILSILPITSDKRISNHSTTFTSSIVITAIKTN